MLRLTVRVDDLRASANVMGFIFETKTFEVNVPELESLLSEKDSRWFQTSVIAIEIIKPESDD